MREFVWGVGANEGIRLGDGANEGRCVVNESYSEQRLSLLFPPLD